MNGNLSGIIVSVSCEGACACVKLSEEIHGRFFALLDPKTQGYSKLRYHQLGGTLHEGGKIALVLGVELRGNDLVITMVD